MALHFSEMLRLLDHAYQYRSLVDIYAWEGGTGEVIHYKGWLVHHVNWRGGYVRLRNPKARATVCFARFLRYSSSASTINKYTYEQ